MRGSVALVGCVVAVAAVGCGGGDGAAEDSPDALTVVADASTESGWALILPAFATSDAGQDVEVATSFGLSGHLVGDVVDGDAADLVNLSAVSDVDQLVRATKVSEDWNADVTGGIPFTSVVSLVVREGNSLSIDDWDDLLAPGVEVVVDNPLSCAGAKSHLLAPYAVMSKGGQNPAAGSEFIDRLVGEHAVVSDDGACDAADRFVDGEGDVLIASENDAIRLVRDGDAVRRVDLPQTFEVAYPAAVVSGSPRSRQAVALRNFLFTTEGQTLWAQAGFRPVDPGVLAEYAAEFSAPRRVWEASDLGGWGEIDRQLFDEQRGILTAAFA